MKAQELRLGNWLYYRNYLTGDEMLDAEPNAEKPYNLQCVTPHVIEWVEKGDKVYEPIPLTEEWLVKLGFEENAGRFTNGHKEYCAHNYDFRFTITTDHEDNVGLCAFGSDDDIVLTVKYVHQLQNLFHSLTGEELTIKELVT